MKIEEMNLDELDNLLATMPNEIEIRSLTENELNTHIKNMNKITIRRNEIKRKVESRDTLIQRVLNEGVVIEQHTKNNGEINNMEKRNKQKLEMKSIQKYLNKLDMTLEERSALTTTGASVVIPSTVQDTLITDDSYSDLLNRATVINDTNQGETSIPIASHTSAKWKQEGEQLDSENPELKEIKLKGYELMRLMSISSATSSMSTSNFEQLLLNLLSSEVIETLEESFIKGTGTNQSLGLDNTEMTNEIIKATTEIKAKDIASAIAKLPNKYARNAIIIANSETLYKLMLDTSENDKNMSLGSETFLNKELSPNEHMANDVVYVVDPKELYVKFAMPIELEVDRSAGFRSATSDLRALTVVDAKWNPHAVSKVIVEQI